MAVQCEICGGTNIKKEAIGDFVCQDCGAAYSVDAMRILITGEVIDDADTTIGAVSTGAPTMEEKLESDVVSNYNLGNFERAKALLDNYIVEKRKLIGQEAPIPTNEIPRAYFLGRLAGMICEYNNGKSSSFSGIAMYLHCFVDDIIENSQEGSECVNAICEMYVTAATECINRAQDNISIAKTATSLYERTYDVDGFKASVDARINAQLLLNNNREAREEAILGCAYVCALGMDVDDEALSNISELCSDLDEKSKDIPHIKAAVKYLKSAMRSASPDQRRKISEDLQDVEELVSCGKALWRSSDYGLASRVFALALKTRKEDFEATCYSRIFNYLNHITHSTVIADHYVANIEEEFGGLIEQIYSSSHGDPILEMIDANNLIGQALIDYSSYLKTLSTIQLIDDEPFYEDTKKLAIALSNTFTAIGGKALDFSAKAIAKDKTFTREQYAILKQFGGKVISADTNDFAAARALESIKNSFLETYGTAADFSAQEKAVADAQKAVKWAQEKIEPRKRERAKLGMFDRKRKKELDDEIASFEKELDKYQWDLKNANAALDKAKATRDAAWVNLR